MSETFGVLCGGCGQPLAVWSKRMPSWAKDILFHGNGFWLAARLTVDTKGSDLLFKNPAAPEPSGHSLGLSTARITRWKWHLSHLEMAFVSLFAQALKRFVLNTSPVDRINKPLLPRQTPVPFGKLHVEAPGRDESPGGDGSARCLGISWMRLLQNCGSVKTEEQGNLAPSIIHGPTVSHASSWPALSGLQGFSLQQKN